MKLKGDLGTRCPKVPFEFHELCYNGGPTRAFLHARLVERFATLPCMPRDRAVARVNLPCMARDSKFEILNRRLFVY